MQRRGVDRDRLVEVAKLYRAAIEDGDDRGPRIAKELHYSKGYARRLVMKARARACSAPHNAARQERRCRWKDTSTRRAVGGT